MMRFALLLFALISSSSCSLSGPRPVLLDRNVPATGVVNDELIVAKELHYAIQISYKFDPDIPSDRDRAWKFSGGTNRGAPFSISVHLQERGEGGPHTIYKETIKNPTLTSWGAGVLNAEIARVQLPPGRYDIDVRITDGTLPTELATRLNVVRAYSGK